MADFSNHDSWIVSSLGDVECLGIKDELIYLQTDSVLKKHFQIHKEKKMLDFQGNASKIAFLYKISAPCHNKNKSLLKAVTGITSESSAGH